MSTARLRPWATASGDGQVLVAEPRRDADHVRRWRRTVLGGGRARPRRLRSSAPVRTGNEAVTQLQLDVYSEVLDSAAAYWRGLIPQESTWSPDLIMAILEHLD